MKKEILRLHGKGIGKKTIARVLKVSKNTVKKYVDEADMGVDVAKAEKKYAAPWSPKVEWKTVKDETDRGTPISEFWEEHIEVSTDAELKSVQYVAFWREFRRRYPEVPLEFHKIHPPGERSEADYKGDAPGLGYVDRNGQYIPCRLFGSILAFSQLLFVRATETEKQVDFLPALARGYEYFGGVSHTTAVDNAKPQVIRAHRYDPDLNPEFSHFCEYYDTAPLAMRPYKPKDKNLIENALGVFWRWARRRNPARRKRPARIRAVPNVLTVRSVRVRVKSWRRRIAKWSPGRLWHRRVRRGRRFPAGRSRWLTRNRPGRCRRPGRPAGRFRRTSRRQAEA